MKLTASNMWTVLEAEAPAAEQPGSTGSTQSTTSGTPSAPANEDLESTRAEAESTVDESESTDEWDFLADSDEDAEAGEGAAAPLPAAPKLAETPKPAEGQPPTTPEPPAGQPAGAAQTTQPVVAQPPTGEQPPAQKTREQLEQEAREATTQYQGQLEQAYALPKEFLDELETDEVAALPKVLPKLAAQLHMAVENAVLARVAAHIPLAIQQHTVVSEANRAAKDMFHKRWPGLEQHEEAIFKVGRMFREANPNATPQEALERVGPMVYMALGLPLPNAPGTGQQGGAPAAAATATPQAPAAAAGGFRPASPGGAGSIGAPPKPANEFEALAEEFEREDS